MSLWRTASASTQRTPPSNCVIDTQVHGHWNWGHRIDTIPDVLVRKSGLIFRLGFWDACTRSLYSLGSHQSPPIRVTFRLLLIKTRDGLSLVGGCSRSSRVLEMSEYKCTLIGAKLRTRNWVRKYVIGKYLRQRFVWVWRVFCRVFRFQFENKIHQNYQIRRYLYMVEMPGRS